MIDLHEAYVLLNTLTKKINFFDPPLPSELFSVIMEEGQYKGGSGKMYD